ncbi:MAG: DUF2235 domain-containing protein [Elainellaceae cyanobacterium]
MNNHSIQRPRKRLVICCDGTWQALAGEYPTNVIKMAQVVKPIASDGVPQVVFYGQGIGTRGKLLEKLGGGAFGWGIDENIQDAYQFLCLNYDPEDESHLADEIYMFGFSRGAYTIRSLAGLIRCAGGLLPRQEVRKTPQAYRIYRSRQKYDRSLSLKEINKLELQRKEEEMRNLSKGIRPIKITLLGCWDTVGSLGVPAQFPLLSQWVNRKYQFHDYKLSNIIEHALHAVAIDECRRAFDVAPMQQQPDNINRGQTLHQVWFPGVHGCIGGGTEALRGLSDAALQWMMDQIKALELGLDLNRDLVEYDIRPNAAAPYGLFPDHKTPFNANISFFYKILGEKLRLMEDEQNPLMFDPTGTNGTGANSIHRSAIDRWCDPDLSCDPKQCYRPRNMPEWLVAKLSDNLPIA